MSHPSATEWLLVDPIDEILERLDGALHPGSFWRRTEWAASNISYNLHFTVLSVGAKARVATILVHDGAHAGQIMSLRKLEEEQWMHVFQVVAYHPVMDDEIDRVRFSPPR